jgi:hypothetical protein
MPVKRAFYGGGKETRTPDPYAASVMLYQLSYAPALHATAPLFTQRSCAPWPRGGDEGTRTPDPLLAKQVLYQLSYIPKRHRSFCAIAAGAYGTVLFRRTSKTRTAEIRALSHRLVQLAEEIVAMVGHPGIEPGTSCLSSMRSNQLS